MSCRKTVTSIGLLIRKSLRMSVNFALRFIISLRVGRDPKGRIMRENGGTSQQMTCEWRLWYGVRSLLPKSMNLTMQQSLNVSSMTARKKPGKNRKSEELQVNFKSDFLISPVSLVKRAMHASPTSYTLCTGWTFSTKKKSITSCIKPKSASSARS
jgi:hypothetical protein